MKYLLIYKKKLIKTGVSNLEDTLIFQILLSPLLCSQFNRKTKCTTQFTVHGVFNISYKLCGE